MPQLRKTTYMQISGRMTPEQFWRHIDETDAQVRLAAATTRLFGLEQWDESIMIGDWGWESQRLQTAGLAYGTPDDDVSVHIATVIGDPRREAFREISRATGVLPSNPAYKDERRRIQESRGEAVTLRIDGVGVEFEMWGGPSRWWAAGHVDGVGITIEGRNYPVEQLSLIEVHDVEPYLLGRRTFLQAARGELE